VVCCQVSISFSRMLQSLSLICRVRGRMYSLAEVVFTPSSKATTLRSDSLRLAFQLLPLKPTGITSAARYLFVAPYRRTGSGFLSIFTRYLLHRCLPFLLLQPLSPQLDEIVVWLPSVWLNRTPPGSSQTFPTCHHGS